MIKKKAASVKYFDDNIDVPVITALGDNKIADLIIEIAKKNNIKIIESKEFFNFESLFSVNEEIPIEVYKIVVDILVYIIKTNK